MAPASSATSPSEAASGDATSQRCDDVARAYDLGSRCLTVATSRRGGLVRFAVGCLPVVVCALSIRLGYTLVAVYFAIASVVGAYLIVAGLRALLAPTQMAIYERGSVLVRGSHHRVTLFDDT